MNNSGLRIRVDDELRERFIVACKNNDLTAAQVLRDFMRHYVEKSSPLGQYNLFNSSIRSQTDQTFNDEISST